VSKDIFNYTSLLKAPSSLALNVSRDGASTTSLGNLFQCFTTLVGKNFFLISSLNLPSLSHVTTGLAKKIVPIFPIGPIQVLKGYSKVSSRPSLLQAEQLHFSHPVLVGEVLQPSDHFRLCFIFWSILNLLSVVKHQHKSMSLLG